MSETEGVVANASDAQLLLSTSTVHFIFKVEEVSDQTKFFIFQVSNNTLLSVCT